jgi:hypothetical protein
MPFTRLDNAVCGCLNHVYSKDVRTAWPYHSSCEASCKRCDEFVLIDRIYHCKRLLSCQSDLGLELQLNLMGSGQCQCLKDYEHSEKQILTLNFSILNCG